MFAEDDISEININYFPCREEIGGCTGDFVLISYANMKYMKPKYLEIEVKDVRTTISEKTKTCSVCRVNMVRYAQISLFFIPPKWLFSNHSSNNEANKPI